MKLFEQFVKFCEWAADNPKVNFEATVLTSTLFTFIGLLLTVTLIDKLNLNSRPNIACAILVAIMYIIQRFRTSQVFKWGKQEGILEELSRRVNHDSESSEDSQ